MRIRGSPIWLSACALGLAVPASAESVATSIRIDAGPLPHSLQALERQTGAELLFDGSLVSEHDSPAVTGTLTTEAALRELLSRTDLTVRKATSGAWIIERPATAPLAQPDAAVAEILVVGTRTQNADIRRTENDVQPYTVFTREEIRGAHRDDVDQFFMSRVTANTVAVPPGAQQQGSTLSEVDLRGLGPEETLVLVDGRRMPSVSDSYYGFHQSDVNGIPLHAIKRIEVLTGTAGGIYGFGALGGVVNVILDRDTSGLDVHFTNGLSSRGDGHRQAIEAKYGRSFNDGDTDLVVFASHSRSETVLAGQRDMATLDRRRSLELVPDFYDLAYKHGDSIEINSIDHVDPATGKAVATPLVLKPEYGGATLSSNRTYLPKGSWADAQALAAALTQHAGQTDLTPTDVEAGTDLGSNPRSDALLVNLHQRFGDRLEAFADAILLRDRGESDGDRTHTQPSVTGLVAPGSPFNPFTDFVWVSFPVQGLSDSARTRVESSRYTAGLVGQLPAGWRGSAEYSAGRFRSATEATVEGPATTSIYINSGTGPNPFGDWDALQGAVGKNPRSYTRGTSLHTRFHDLSLRFAGPVFGTDTGRSTLTLLAERRTEELPAYRDYSIQSSADGTTHGEDQLPQRSMRTTSLYAELRMRLSEKFETQLAARRDVEKDHFAADVNAEDPTFIHSEFAGTTYTAGAKLTPTSWLMLRGSYATGERPPVLNYLAELPPLEYDFALPIPDPRRGGVQVGSEGPVSIENGGNAALRSVFATTTSLGAVLTPFGREGARLALDFSRIRRTRDVFVPDLYTMLDHEDYWPQRVGRAPLTDADRARGYTGGRVTSLDWSFTNGTTIVVDAFDLHADWPLALFGGRFKLYADATHYLRNVREAPFQPDVNRVGFYEGPLKWRANGGFDWSLRSLTLGANVQFFARTLVYKQEPQLWDDDTLVEFQGSRHIASQWYLDLYGNWQIPARHLGPLDELTVNFGVVNVLDKAPPRESALVSDDGPGYSRYGDPRRRRFELTLSCHF